MTSGGAGDGGGKRRVSLEDVVDALSAQCDGARRRDGMGFSRADAQEGGRLSALKRRGMAWNTDDARKALEITARYAKQAGGILGDGDDGKAGGIERALRSGRVACADPVDDGQPPYNYCCLSPGGKRALFLRAFPPPDRDGYGAGLRALAGMRHGERRVSVDFDVASETTRNGRKLRLRRSEVDLNGTTRDGVLALAAKHGFVVEPALGATLDGDIDALRRSARAAWVHSGHRNGERGEWAVFDLDRRHEPFSAAVKRHALDPATRRRLYSCDPRDDWNWYVAWDGRTRALVASLASHFGFATCPAIAAALRG